ncbi:Clp protease ClpP [Vibrio hannami]
MASKTKPTNKGVFKLVNAADTEPLTIYLYGYIGWYNSDGIDLKAALIGHEERDLIVRFHTDGGDVDEGLMIHNLLKDHKGHVTGIVDGSCYSIAVPILCACDTVYVRETSTLMIHQAWGYFEGNVQAAEQWIERTQKADLILAQTIASKCGKPVEDVQSDMLTDFFLTGQEAIEYGLADGFYSESGLNNASVKFKPLSNCLKESGQMDSSAKIIVDLKNQLNDDSSQTEPGDEVSEVEPGSGEPNTNEPASSTNLDNSEGENMGDKTTPTKIELQNQFRKDEKTRIAGLNAAAKPFLDHPGVREKLNAAKDDPETSIDAFNSALLTMLGTDTDASVSTNVDGGKSNRDHLVNYVQFRLGAAKLDADNVYGDASSMFEALKAHHKNEGYDPIRSQTKLLNSAFDNDKTNLGDIFETATQMVIDNEMAKQRNWHSEFVERRPMSIGTANKIFKMKDVAAPSEKTEHGEVRHVRLEGTKEVCSISPFALKLEITKEVILADNFDFVQRNVAKLVASVAAEPQRLLMRGLESNRKLFDGNPLFIDGLNDYSTLELDAATLAKMSGDMGDMLTAEGEPLELEPIGILSSVRESKRLNAIMKSDKIDNKPNEGYEAYPKAVGTARLAKKDTAFAFGGGNGFTGIIEGYVADEDGVQIERLPTDKLSGISMQIWTYTAIYFADRRGVQRWKKKVS